MAKIRKQKRVLGQMLAVAVVAAAATLLPAASASAGFFDLLFGGGRRSAPNVPAAVAPLVNAFTDPTGSVSEGSRGESGPAVSYCVRLCDGHPFPVQRSNSSSAQTCSSMCPAAKTKVFAGGSIDGAVASDGKRYADLPNAFAYRKQIVADCTCNGKTPGGLVRADVKSDPTLRPGDIVATNEGLVSYRGSNGKSADFTPVKDHKLSAIEVRPAPASDAALAARAEEPPPRYVDEPSTKKSKNRAQR